MKCKCGTEIPGALCHVQNQTHECSCGRVWNASSSPPWVLAFHTDKSERVMEYRGEIECSQERYVNLREALAAYAHDAWSRWMEYLFSKCDPMGWIKGNSVIIPEEFVNRWQRQMTTPYDDLPEEEKESDRSQAEEILELLERRESDEP